MGGPGVSAIEALQGLNVAIDLVRAVIASGSAIDKAELKLKLAETLEALAEAKVSISDSERELRDALAEVARLTNALSTKGETVRIGDALYMLKDGKAQGTPYCLNCWEARFMLRSLIAGERSDNFNHCLTCRNKYTKSRSTFDLEAAAV